MTMKDSERYAYFTERLAEAEKELASYNNAVAQHGLCVYHRDMDGERGYDCQFQLTSALPPTNLNPQERRCWCPESLQVLDSKSIRQLFGFSGLR
jgi:hypothetical protein